MLSFIFKRFARTEHVLHKYTETINKAKQIIQVFLHITKNIGRFSYMYLTHQTSRQCMSFFSHVLFQEETVRLIYSYSNQTDLRYHGPTKRGTKSVSLLSEVQVPETMPSDIRHIEFLNRNVSYLIFTSKE